MINITKKLFVFELVSALESLAFCPSPTFDKGVGNWENKIAYLHNEPYRACRYLVINSQKYYFRVRPVTETLIEFNSNVQACTYRGCYND